MAEEKQEKSDEQQPTAETSYDTVFGKMALNQGLCTDQELRHSLNQLNQRRRENPMTLKELMIELGYVTETQADRLKDNIKMSKAAAHQIPGYKIFGKLGSGAMAVVYKARQLSLNRIVAIKILPKRLEENPEYVQRFYKEGQAAAKLNHNNIVQAFDVGEAGGYHYFVMEYVEGKTLHDDLASGKVFSEQEAIDIVIQVANALAHAHARGLIHRDIKPKNIMIDKAGTVKVADMGLARATEDVKAAKTEAGKAYGTPYYIAPEQIRGEMDIDGRVDIYALGATFFHLVTGRVPFEADEPAEVMKKHLREPLTPPDHINTSLSAGVSEVIEIMMTKRRQNRYKDVKELLVDLNSIKAGQPPLRARKRFDVTDLRKLEQGEEVEIESDETETYEENILTRYKVAVLILAAVAAVSLLGVILLVVHIARSGP